MKFGFKLFNCSKKENEMLTLSASVKYSETVKVHIS